MEIVDHAPKTQEGGRPTIALLCPGSSEPDQLWRPRLEAYRQVLAATGAGIVDLPWDEAGDLIHFDLVLPLLAWGYHLDPSRWMKLLDSWESRGVQLAIDPALLRWNSCKTYLRDLAMRGVPIVPTLWREHGETCDVDALLAELGSQAIVIKPQISGSSYRTYRLRRGERPGELGCPVMIQPYLSSVEQRGETSLFYFDGRFSHAVRKVAAPGDYRAQPEFDAAIKACWPSEEECKIARSALDALGKAVPYCRLDLINDDQDRPLLMEMELIEPDLYLEFAPDAGLMFADAVYPLLRGPQPACGARHLRN